jgi:hypothetical protein
MDHDSNSSGHTNKRFDPFSHHVESLIRPLNASIYVGLLVLNEPARDKIESFASVLTVTELSKRDNVYDETNSNFSPNEKKRLLRNSRKTGCGPSFEKGFGENGLLVAFKHGCPNNSLPILWYEGKKWLSLFNRRAI